MPATWNTAIFLKNSLFEEKAQLVFDYQLKHCGVYRRFCNHFGISDYEGINKVPLLPVQVFREAEVVSDEVLNPALKFQSSGTTGMRRSRHLVGFELLYRTSVLEGIKEFYPLKNFVILGYTPGYADNPNSSLIWMIKTLIEQDVTKLSRFLPLNLPIPQELLDEISSAKKRILLFGAAFGFLDLIEKFDTKLPADSIILETGGMKTHRREISREKLHENIADGFGVPKTNVHSEYGMTEMLSQAYCRDGFWFEPVPWLQVSIRNPENPLEMMPDGQPGLLGILDLANVFSCSFLLTQDVGVRRSDGAFQVLGRHKSANLRGCNFLIEQE